MTKIQDLKWYHITLLFTLLAFIFNYPLFKKLHYLGTAPIPTDWIYWLTWHNITRSQILKDHIFPLWQHVLAHTWGGYPHFHNPQTDVITPFVLPVLFFGETIGVKINWTLHIIIGMVGMYYISEYFNGRGVFNLVPPVISMLSGYFTIRFAGGHCSWYTLGLLPLAFYFFLKSGEKKLYTIPSAFLLSLIYYEGGQHVFIWSFMFIGIYAVIASILGFNLRYLLFLGTIFFLTVGLTAAKLFPMVEMFHSYSARTHRGYEIADLAFALLSRHQTIETVRPLADFSDGAGWWEFGSYVGILPIFLGAIGIATLQRKHIPLILTGTVILWMTLHVSPPFNIWEKIQRLPVMESQRIPTRYIILFIFVLAIMAGAGLRYLSDRAWVRRTFNIKGIFIFPLVVFIIIYADLLIVNSPVYYQALRAKTIPPSQSFRPEVFLLYGGEVAVKEYIPHKIVVQANTDTDNLLVFKGIAHWPSWKSTAGKIISYRGHMAIVVSPTEEEITLYYSPKSFKFGIFLSLLTSLLCLFLIWRRIRK